MNNTTRFNRLTDPKNGGKYKIESLAETKREIVFLVGELEHKQAVVYFAVGERLTAMKEKLEHGKFMSYIENEFPYCQQTANKYMRLFDFYKDDPSSLGSLNYREALITAGIIKPKESNECSKYNRVDLGGDPGQINFDFGELFEAPSAINPKLQNYRTIGDLLSEIIVVRRADDGTLTSKRIVKICENIPQNTLLKIAYKTMSQKIQTTVEEYLAILENNNS